MKIGVISDTHIPGRAQSLPEIVIAYFKEAGHIIHAGDIRSAEVLTELEKLAPVTAVAGNIDPPKLQSLLGYKKTVALGGVSFGIVHGHGSKGTTLERAVQCFIHDAVDCIVFGHSHNPCCEYQGDILLFNPGSPTDKRRNKYFSFGLLETGKSISASIIYFDAKGDVVRY